MAFAAIISCGKTADPQKLARPVPTLSSAGPDNATITWKAVANAESYEIVVNDAVYSVTGTTIYLNGLQPSTYYTLKMKAVAPEGSSRWQDSDYCPAFSFSTERHVIRVATLNVRSGMMSESSAEHEWNNRKKGVCAWASASQPDVFCTQECYPNQRADIINLCSDYLAIYHTDSQNVIFYRKGAMTVESYGSFWLVDGTPTSVDKTSVQANERSATWMKCTFSGRKMLILDTHLSYRTAQNSDSNSHEMQQLRSYEMKVITTWLDSNYNPSSDGCLLFMGDFNIDQGNAIFNGWKDGTYGYYARDKAPGADTGRTFNNWGGSGQLTIDHQFYSGFPSVLSYKIDRASYGGITYISDHWPVVVEYRMD